MTTFGGNNSSYFRGDFKKGHPHVMEGSIQNFKHELYEKAAKTANNLQQKEGANASLDTENV